MTRELARHQDLRIIHPLTPHEVDILYARATGKRTQEISQTLKISPATLKSIESTIRGKLNVPNRTSAVVTAIRLGIIDLDQIEVKFLP